MVLLGTYSSPLGENTLAAVDLPVIHDVTLSGRVCDDRGNPVEGALVQAGGYSVTTDSKGDFSFGALPRGDHPIQVTQQGFAPTYEFASAPFGGRSWSEITAMPVTHRTQFAADEGANLSGPDGVEVFFPLGTIAGHGRIDVSWTLLTSEQARRAGPGELRTESDALESLGMVEVSLTRKGEKVDLQAPVELHLPVADASVWEGDILGLYHFDPAIGSWVQEGEAEVRGGQFVSEVSHFSWWCVGRRKSESECVLEGNAVVCTEVKK